jgi:tetratricopeptide (TPR) repeat protein
MGDKEKMVQGLDRLGLIACDRQQYDDATTFLEEALALTREMDDKSEMAHLLKGLGFVALYQGQSDQAHKSFVESLALVSEKNDRRSIAGILVGVAGSLATQSNYESAAELIGAAEVLLEAPVRAPIHWKGAPIELDSYLDKERGWVADRIQLNEEAFQAARARGRTMSLQQTIGRAVNG